MKNEYCLVCEQDTMFIADDDCLRCMHWLSLPYNKVDKIVLDHREEWQNRGL